MRIFGSVNIGRFMEDDMPIEHRWINKAIENAQRKVEGHNFDIRKHLLEYDDVMNQQRKTIYALRRAILEGRYSVEAAADEKAKGNKAHAEELREAAEARKAEVAKHKKDLEERLRPHLVQIVDAMFAQASQPTPATDGEGGDGVAPYRAKPGIDSRAFKNAVY